MSDKNFIKNLAHDIKNMHMDRVKWRSETVSVCREESRERREGVAELLADFKKEREETRDAWKKILFVMAKVKKETRP